MKNVSSEKQLKWTKKDALNVILVYVLNVIILAIIYAGMVFFNDSAKGITFTEYFSNPVNFLNFVMLVAIVSAVMGIYFFFEDKNFLKSPLNSEMLFLVLEISIVICIVVSKYLDVYLRPLPLVSLLILFLAGGKKAVFMNIVFCTLMFVFDGFSGQVDNLEEYSSFYFFVAGLSSGVLATYFLDRVYSRLKLLAMSLLLSLPSVICIALPVLYNASLEFNWRHAIFGALSGPFSVAVFIFCLPFLEFIFKKISYFRLSELTEHKAKLVKKLINNAPGTFNHSIVVSQIAEACATAIDEDALLARTCAYYHDIGKLRRPEFFTENQSDGINPHDDLTPELSANIIKSHTVDGYSLVMKNRLPKEIADVCIEHHGTMPILYFYNKAKQFTDGEVPLQQYCYAGPKPQTKIAAIIMIADGCEAVARTLKDRSRESVLKAVKGIINQRMQLGQFDECEITLKELNIIINTVVNNLTGVYHERIKYPKVSLEGLDVDGEKAEEKPSEVNKTEEKQEKVEKVELPVKQQNSPKKTTRTSKAKSKE